MKYSILIQSIEILLQDLQELLAKQPKEDPIHPLDLDLMQQKTREIYDNLLHLRTLEKEENTTDSETEPNVDIVDQDQNPENTYITEVSISSASIEEVLQAESKDDIAEEVSFPESISPAPVENEPQEIPHQKKTAAKEAPVKTTLDLFSGPTTASLGERLTNPEQTVVAEKLKKHINDLREGIGINDKFLFINELFHGDLGKYNKVLDELNSLSSLRGAQTYLTELSVQYQWGEEGQAFIKLSEIIDRKFS